MFTSGGAVWEGIKDGIGNVFKDNVNVIIDGLNQVISAPFNTINSLVDWVNSIPLPHWDPGISYIDVPQIPRLATGTVVPANYGEFLAILGDNKRSPEIVTPETAMEQVFERVLARHDLGGGDITIENVWKVDGRKIHREVVKVNREEIRKTGNNPLAAT